MKKPSPLAARMLRAMIRYDVGIKLTRYDYGSHDARWIRNNDDRDEQLSLADIKVKDRNVKAALKNGWLEIYETKENRFYIDDFYHITQEGRDIIASLDAEDFYPKEPEITHRQLKIFMKQWYEREHPTFIYLPELAFHGQKIDGYGMALWHSLDFQAVAYEMKASRADFLSELRNPEKRYNALRISHKYFFVTPRKLVAPKEIPDPCGLIEINTAGRVFTILDAPFRRVTPPGWDFVALLLRHAKALFENQLDDAGMRKDRWY